MVFIVRRYGRLLFLGVLVFVISGPVLVRGNPNDYPRFAKQSVDDTITIAFISAPEVKQRLDTGEPQVLIDVRGTASYAREHLPGAISIPLDVLPARVHDVPHDVPVVLY